jgi:hypothetical protein
VTTNVPLANPATPPPSLNVPVMVVPETVAVNGGPSWIVKVTVDPETDPVAGATIVPDVFATQLLMPSKWLDAVAVTLMDEPF